MTYSTTKLDRRQWLGAVTVGASLASPFASWLPALAVESPEKRPTKSVILLWLNGGPATIDMWDMKPGHANGGSLREIATDVVGLRVSEHFAKTAKHANSLAIVRSVNTREGDHGRAVHFLRTGYLPQASIQFPSLGAVVAHGIDAQTNGLPRFVSIGPSRYPHLHTGGFLGPNFAPFTIGVEGPQAALDVPYLERFAHIDERQQQRRWQLLQHMNEEFTANHNSEIVKAMRSASIGAEQLMQPQAREVFLLDREAASVRDTYGRTQFGQGCLLARRLVEQDVPFVEVTLDGWDTHNSNFTEVARLSNIVDTGLSSLLSDLRASGRLASTVVVCMGEFGRTPRINTNGGRDHWPRCWSVLLAGGGLHGGQVIGSTTEDGMEVKDRPVSVPDVMATICAAVGLEPRHQNMSNVGRPIRRADPAANIIKELL